MVLLLLLFIRQPGVIALSTVVPPYLKLSHISIILLASSFKLPSLQMRILINVLSLLSTSFSSPSLPVTSSPNHPSSSSSGILLCGGSMTDHYPYLVTCEVGWVDNSQFIIIMVRVVQSFSHLASCLRRSAWRESFSAFRNNHFCDTQTFTPPSNLLTFQPFPNVSRNKRNDKFL